MVVSDSLSLIGSGQLLLALCVPMICPESGYMPTTNHQRVYADWKSIDAKLEEGD